MYYRIRLYVYLDSIIANYDRLSKVKYLREGIMTSLKPSDDNVYGGKWSLEKLNCIESYLRAFLAVMRKQDWADLWYIDAFCGSGIQRFPKKDDGMGLFDGYDLDMVSFTEGSAFRAIKLTSEFEQEGSRGFDHFVFVEKDPSKLEELKELLLSNFPSQIEKCSFELGDVNERLPETLRRIPWYQNGRGVTFIDPCAMQMKWSTLQCFSQTLSDVWLLLPIEAMRRVLAKESMPTGALARTLDEFFGSSDWRSLYLDSAENQLSLFDDLNERALRREEGDRAIVAYAETRLNLIFSKVLEPAYLRKENGVAKFLLYPLISNHNKRAIEVASRIAMDLVSKINRGC